MHTDKAGFLAFAALAKEPSVPTHTDARLYRAKEDGRDRIYLDSGSTEDSRGAAPGTMSTAMTWTPCPDAQRARSVGLG